MLLVFAFCKLSSITFSSGLTTIGDSAFYGCSSLTSVDFSNCSKLTTIDGNAFRYCSELNSITFPSSLESIGDFTFGNCSSLTSIIFPSSLESIDNETFWECSNLSSITLDSWNGSFDSLSESAFEGVSPTGGTVSVKNPVDGHDSDELLQYLLDNGGLPSTWAKSIPLPEDVYNIEDNVLKGFTSEFLANPSAYSDCNTMLIPASVASVNNYAFYSRIRGSSTIPSFIKNLTFPENSNCFSIGQRSFIACSSLASITFPSSLELIDDSVFSNCSSLNYISWDLPDEYETEIINFSYNVFLDISSSGTVKSLNPSISSEQLLEFLKTNADLPEGWTAA